MTGALPRGTGKSRAHLTLTPLQGSVGGESGRFGASAERSVTACCFRCSSFTEEECAPGNCDCGPPLSEKLLRSRLYQHRFLQSNTHFAAFFEIYKICFFLTREDQYRRVKNRGKRGKRRKLRTRLHPQPTSTRGAFCTFCIRDGKTLENPPQGPATAPIVEIS